MGKMNPFGQNEADKTIENTINRDWKQGGGYIGFSTNFATTQRWVLNDSRLQDVVHIEKYSENVCNSSQAVCMFSKD